MDYGGYGAATDNSGNIYITGYTNGGLDGNTNSGSSDIFLTKYDKNGNKQWTKQLGTISPDVGSWVNVDNSGNIYVTGHTCGGLDGNTNAGEATGHYEDIFLTKYDASGTKQWTKQIGTGGDDGGSGVATDSLGNIYVTGYTWGDLDGNTNSGGKDIFLIKYDASGTKQWTEQLGTGSNDEGIGIAIDNSDNIFVTGSTSGGLDGNTNSGGLDIFLTKYDTDGNRQWTKQIGTTGDDCGYGLATDSSGNIYIAGSTDFFLTKYDTDGNKQWTKQIGTGGQAIATDSSDNIYVTGQVTGGLDGNTGAGSADIFLTKYDADGNKQWTKQLGTVDNDEGFGVATYGSDNIYVSGSTYGGLDGNTNSGSWDIFLIKWSATTIPTLSWTEETNYESDGIDPETGYSTTTFTFEIKYTDADNDAPLSGYPKVHIKKGGTDISGSPFTMTYVSDSYDSGATYTYSKSGLSAGTNYTYYFEANDSNGAVATGTPTTPIDAPDVSASAAPINNAPTLSWTGEENYESDGLDPETGDTSTTFVFKIKYTDADNDAPAGSYPKVHIKKGGTEMSGSPFTMTYVSGANSTGATYTYSKSGLSAGTDYTYYFEANDSTGAAATGAPITPIDTPDVSASAASSNNAPTLSWTGETNYESDGLDPETGYSTTTFIFAIKYTDADNDAPASGYPKVHIKKGGTEISGSPFTMTYVSDSYDTGAIYTYSKTGLSAGTDYTYYFEAQDSTGAAATGTPTNPIDAPDILLLIQPRFIIKGYVRDSGGSGVSDVTVTLSGSGSATYTTTSNGYYEFTNLTSGRNYTITPSKSNYSFNPENKSYANLAANQDNQNFTGIYITNQPSEIKIVGGTESKGTINPDRGESAKINFAGTGIGKFVCKIFALTGELVWEDTKENVSAGQFDWIPKNIASGIYIVYVEGPGIKIHKKMAILR